jgi:membrane protein DedA with SNARE-associated domain/rhodanese-related sulfurtransferase
VAPFGLGIVFFNVLLEQLGLPVPAIPTLIVAGALAADGRLPALGVGALALLACLIGDSAWYLAGRAYGVRVMKLLCRISLTPDICVSQTQRSFERWGVKALIFAKFIPGLSMIAPPLAGATRMSFARFAGFSVLGSSAWIGAALLAGLVLKPQIVRLVPKLTGVGGAALVILLVLLAAYIIFKWWERRRFYVALEMARISVAELHARMHGGAAPVVVDVRSSTAQGLEQRRIPGALHVPMQEVERHMGSLPRDSEIILYCTCPNEASAAQAARVLLNHGFRRVRPLRGGLDAWIAAGYAVEDIAAGAGVGVSAAVAEPRPFRPGRPPGRRQYSLRLLPLRPPRPAAPPACTEASRPTAHDR